MMIEDIKLGDSYELIKHIPNNSIDIIVTDPPYNINYAEWDTFKNINYISSEFHRILKPTGQILIFSGWSFVINVINDFDKRFKLNDWIIYDRIKGRGATKRLVSTREDLLWYVKSNEWTFNKQLAYSNIIKKTKGMGDKNGHDTRALSNVWTDISPIVPWSKERVNHPTQKSKQIIERILKVFSNENDIVFDPFAGSGTTGVVAKEMNRQFILFEQNEEYFEIIKNRLNNINKQNNNLFNY